jgi:hypothetical protein
MSKKPDSVVWDSNIEKYNASVLPYATNVGGPVIKLEDIDQFKERGVTKVQKIFNSKYEELIQGYNKLVEEVRLNELVYNSKISFEPVIGEIYHLYNRHNGEYFLSLIQPSEWTMKHVVSVRLNSEHKWELVNE